MQSCHIRHYGLSWEAACFHVQNILLVMTCVRDLHFLSFDTRQYFQATGLISMLLLQPSDEFLEDFVQQDFLCLCSKLPSCLSTHILGLCFFKMRSSIQKGTWQLEKNKHLNYSSSIIVLEMKLSESEP